MLCIIIPILYIILLCIDELSMRVTNDTLVTLFFISMLILLTINLCFTVYYGWKSSDGEEKITIVLYENTLLASAPLKNGSFP